MTDLHTELEGILRSKIQQAIDGFEVVANYDSDGDAYPEQSPYGLEPALNEIIPAIEKLIEERYILKSEVKKSVEEIDKALKGENNNIYA